MSGWRNQSLAARCMLPAVLVLAFAGMAWSAEQNGQQEMIVLPKSEFETIKARITAMEEELHWLRQAVGPEEAEPQPVETDSDIDYAEGTPTPIVPAGGRQMLFPDVSVVGNMVGKATTDSSDDERDSFLVREIELGLQGYLYPQIRADVFIALENEHDFGAELEEGYVSFLQLGDTDLSATLGKKRVDFGKINKTHPHHWPYADAPDVIRNFLGDHGLIGQGASVGYLLPTSGRLFAQLDFGVWRGNGGGDENNDHNGHDCVHLGPGFADKFYTSRLWISSPFAHDSELEMGLSSAWGKADDSSDGNVSVFGLDATYKRWPSSHQRILLQGEMHIHRRAGQNRWGYYWFGNYKMDEHWDAGLLFNWSERPFPDTGRDCGLSAIVTNRLTETTALRVQLAHGSRAHTGTVTEGMLQLIWGIGPHSHPLE